MHRLLFDTTISYSAHKKASILLSSKKMDALCITLSNTFARLCNFKLCGCHHVNADGPFHLSPFYPAILSVTDRRRGCLTLFYPVQCGKNMDRQANSVMLVLKFDNLEHFTCFTGYRRTCAHGNHLQHRAPADT